MAFTSGPIINNHNAVTLQVVISNDNSTNFANIELELFSIAVSTATVAKVPLDHQLFTVLANQVITKTFSIAGLAAYETQFNITGAVPGDAVVSIFATNTAGMLVAAQRVLQSERSPISTLTPEP